MITVSCGPDCYHCQQEFICSSGKPDEKKYKASRRGVSPKSSPPRSELKLRRLGHLRTRWLVLLSSSYILLYVWFLQTKNGKEGKETDEKVSDPGFMKQDAVLLPQMF